MFFRDNKGREWEIAVNIAAVKRVKTLAGFNLLEDDALVKMVGDMILMADVLYALIKPQADARGVTDEEFGESLAGDVIMPAMDALVRGIADFFPDCRQRELMKRIWAKAKAAMDAAMDAAMKRSQSALSD